MTDGGSQRQTGAADHEALIVAYFESCNTGEPDRIAAHFTEDAVIYDTNHKPVATSAGIGTFWQRIHRQWDGAVWQVDRVVSDGESAAIEWQMSGTAKGGPFVFRGSEHYGFDGLLIDEIRQYWSFSPEAMNGSGADTGLVQYPYGDSQDRLPPPGGGRADPGRGSTTDHDDGDDR